MSDETNNTDESDASPVAGERLRQARRAKDIAVRDVAKELHIDEHKVRALEKNEFAALGAPVFAKGYLRKYAELVGVSVDDVMTDYYQMNRSVGAPPIVGPRRKVRRELNPMPWIVGFLIAGLLGGAAWWWFSTGDPEPAARVAPSVRTPVATPGGPAPDRQAPAAAAQSTEAAEPADYASESAAESAESASSAAPMPEADQPAPAANDAEVANNEVSDAMPGDDVYLPTPGVPQVSLTLAYSGDCWTEVSDNTGRRLFYELGQAGRSVTLSGDAPLRLILGDADAVELTVEGQPWRIPASARRGQMARLTIPAQ